MDPKKCWEALIAEYDQQNSTVQMLTLDNLLELKCAESVLQYIHEINLNVSKLQAMSIKFDERLLIALLLRGLPGEYEVFRSAVRHRDRVPTLEKLFAMVK